MFSQEPKGILKNVAAVKDYEFHTGLFSEAHCYSS